MIVDVSQVRQFLPFLAVISIGFYLNHFLKKSVQPQDQAFVDDTPAPPTYEDDLMVMRQFWKIGRRIVTEECDGPTNCYEIAEVPSTEEEKPAFNVIRYLHAKGVPGVYLTGVQLMRPPFGQLRLETSWIPINYTEVVSDYIRVMIGTPYFTESLSMDPMVGEQELLMIGLGGGVLPSYFREKTKNIRTTNIEIDPFMVKIAKDWFGYAENERCKTVVTDGMSFVRKSIDEGRRYPAVIVDACENTPELKRLCPVDDFMDSDNVRLLSHIVAHRGVVAVNLLTMHASYPVEEAEALRVYSLHFKSCFLLRFNSARKMLICTERPNWTWAKQKERFLKNMQVVDEEFSFDLHSMVTHYPQQA